MLTLEWNREQFPPNVTFFAEKCKNTQGESEEIFLQKIGTAWADVVTIHEKASGILPEN